MSNLSQRSLIYTDKLQNIKSAIIIGVTKDDNIFINTIYQGSLQDIPKIELLGLAAFLSNEINNKIFLNNQSPELLPTDQIKHILESLRNSELIAKE